MSGGAGRRARGADDAACKKRQKDRANQESRDELLPDWKQNADEIIIKLNLGSSALKVEDMETVFTDTDCIVKLPDGRQWSCQFYEEIESSCSRVQHKKGNFLQLVLQKKIPLHTWASLVKKRKDGPKEPAWGTACWENGKEKAPPAEVAPTEPQADSSLEPPRAKRDPSNPKRAPGRSEALAGRTPLSPGLLSGPSAKRAVYLKAAPSEEEPNARVMGGPEPGKGHGGKAGSRRNGRAGQSEAPSPATDPSLPLEKVELLEKEPMPVEMQPLVDPSETFPLPATACLEKRVLPPAEAARGWECAPAPDEGPKPAPVIATPVLLSRDNEKRDWSKDEAALEATVDEPEPMVSLTFVKNDSYEKGNDLVVVHVYA